MSSKEKAKELFLQFHLHQPLCADRTFRYNAAKQCALICCEEIVNELNEVSIAESGKIFIDYGQSKWDRIKEEINNL